MKVNFSEDSKISKPEVICVEYDDEISCFELGNLVLPPVDPRKLGIVFPCCVIKKPMSQKVTKSNKLYKEDTKQNNEQEMNISYKQTKSSNIKRVRSNECPLSSFKNHPQNTNIVYVFDKNGFSKVISYVKANLDCTGTPELKPRELVGPPGNLDKRITGNQKRMFNAFLNMRKSLSACKSRELRGGVLRTDCLCLRRNGLQYDCRRLGCQNSPLCSVLPAPVCEPSRVACITHCANPHAEDLSNICNLRPW